MRIWRRRNSSSAPAPLGSPSGVKVLQVPSLKRVQSVYQRRTLTNLRSSLKKLVPPDEAHHLAAMIAAMIDGVWLRAALSGWREADSESARALLTEFVDGRLKAGRAVPDEATGEAAAAPQRRPTRSGRAVCFHQSGHRRSAGLRERRGPGASQRGGARGAARPSIVGRDDGRGSGARVAPRGAASAVAQSGARRARIARHRQAHSRDSGGRRHFRRRVLRIFCEPRAILERRAHRSRCPSVRLYAPRAARVWSRASAHGIIRCRSRAGKRRPLSPAAMR